MTCDFGDARLVFPTEDIEIKPRSIDYRMESGKLEYTEAKLSRAAGELLAGRNMNPIPAELHVAGTRIARLSAESDAVRYGIDETFIKLLDPRTVLENGHIQWEPESTTLQDAVEHIFERREDPNGVLTGVRVVSNEEIEITNRKLSEKFKEALRNGREFVNDAGFRPIEDALVRESPEFLQKAHADLLGAVRIPNLTPAEAIQRVAELFNVVSWVDADGVLWFGFPNQNADIATVGTLPGDLILREPRITQSAVPVKAAVVEGMPADVWIDRNGDLTIDPKFLQPGSERYNLRSTATVKGDLGTHRRIFIDGKKIQSFDEIEATALNALRETIFSNNSGSLVLDPVNSDGAAISPYDITVGDILLVPDETNHCGPDTAGGVFAINAVHHHISARRGWSLTVDVGRIIPDSELEVKSEIMGPNMDDWAEVDDFYGGAFGW